MKDDQICKNCRFFHPTHTETSMPLGECRFNPPRAEIYQTYFPDKASIWPHVNETDWCGQFQGKNWWTYEEYTDEEKEQAIQELNRQFKELSRKP